MENDQPPQKSPFPHSDGVRQHLHTGLIQQGLQVVRDLLEYKRSQSGFGEITEEFHSLFSHFVTAGLGKRCVRFVFDGDDGPELGPNWLTISLDLVERRAREAGQVVLELDSDYFDAVLCSGLGRISRPESLILELRRILKRSGQIWIQSPLCGPYLPDRDSNRLEYWRLTPDGLRILLESFDEILCSVYLPEGNALRTCSFFYGLKPAETSGQFPLPILAHMAPPGT
ncbi:hypothetical protein CKO27_17825 [Thiocystis violacea]|nr:hypothetical protein [Thiocystis violacea]